MLAWETATMDPVATYQAYSAAWNEPKDDERRSALLVESWSDEGILVDEETPDGVVGRTALGQYIAETHRAMPGLVVGESTSPQLLGNRIRVTWVASQADVVMYTGTDFIELADDGRIARVTMFYDSVAAEA
jgi:hypothetical protein